MNEVLIVDRHGTQRYVNEFGQLHREDGPAVIEKNGNVCYYQNGNLHRDYDQPAVINDTQRVWYRNGFVHREGDNPAVEITDGQGLVMVREWRKNGDLHRDNGPAIEWSTGSWQYYKNGLLHREDGPAEFIAKDKQLSYALKGEYVSSFRIKMNQMRSSLLGNAKPHLNQNKIA